MGRALLVGFLALLLLASAFGLWATRSAARPHLRAETCERFTARPDEGWVALRECELGFNDVLLQEAGGQFETLANRHEGVSKHLYEQPPRWVRAWVPVRDTTGSAPLPKLLLRAETPDLLAWINRLEQAQGAEKERLWANPVMLLRMNRPAVLTARAQKPPRDLAGQFGGRVSSAALELLPGPPPPDERQDAWLVPLVLGLGLLGVALRMAVTPRREPRGVGEFDARTVDVELGQLRDEDREG